jgi:hypothetical protein
MDFEEFSFSLCNLLAFKGEDFYHGTQLEIAVPIWNLVDQSVWDKVELGSGNSIGFYFSRKKFHLRYSERLEVTESILKELE